MNLKGKNAIITGGGRGLGKAIALILANEGVNIGITGRNEENLKMTVDEIQRLGVNTAYAVFSIDNEIHVKAGIESIVEQLGGVDILINNAGIGDFGSIEEMPSETWEQVIKTNLFGVYYAAKAVYPYLKEKGEGDIVNVASTAGLKGGPNMSAYAASKAAVVSLSQSMMAEWRKQNIRVITLTPSTIASDMSIQGGLTDGNPDKVLQPEDFAEWVRDILKMNRRALIANGSIFSTNP
ncbi:MULTISPECIES: 3-ketoacyl-ACP reductase [Chryseobacterium]|jgi:3-oxoacyl-[acyl-carrier protein] reductase|uniref:3-oxoacyl-[acyl-carrier protein] reductase n=1 Tax=Chryseobacterium scophthalmum TaxID=59733 RepID=A0A1N6FQJ6_9FLAO|nr:MULTISPECIES: 3-ketoacyl-ACP reductase [Chryseobacterium]MBM7421113.1 3-oxoacyl-[acyl-carrier protein] reductase [Chryseobacterium sp. JUb44]MDH6211072.1 3-oxoacyl-[acyl-carrier protein] reductase [Chryseobacterium sp. BIGb0186]REC41161.1 3-ketoacyl-ACP reductase [Chryseobacterium sp. 5_R23647]WSO09736.1 3-ketoacyl-ACP reductase [Chryseobacterium scophthalmum]SIN97530.1 3-oxoacyl-[acyl-carrier protein] reductase [Chryseobacterium scophthalmum]